MRTKQISFNVETNDVDGWSGYKFVFNQCTIVSSETGKLLHVYLKSFYPTKDSRVRPIQDYPIHPESVNKPSKVLSLLRVLRLAFFNKGAFKP